MRDATNLLGLLSLAPYLYALHLGNLRQETVGFEVAFFAAFALYVVAVALALRDHRPAPASQLVLVFLFAAAFRGILVFTAPELSDDMYRYVWDGRVQANGINPYAHPPLADSVQPLRDEAIWPHINRQDAVTVYPAGAELAFATLWRILPDNVRWFQIAMAVGSLVAGALLVPLLRAFGRPTHLVLIYLWSPLVVFETAHAAHIDGLVLPLLVGAWLALARGRKGIAGLALGVATSMKLYPALFLPVLWRRENEAAGSHPHAARGRLVHLSRWGAALVMPLTFVIGFALPYAAYVGRGYDVLGYLPRYFAERFNPGLALAIERLAELWTVEEPERLAAMAMPAVVVVVSLVLLLRPARSAREAIRLCVWPAGAFLLFTQNLFPWYALWVVPLCALFLRPGRFGLRFDAWTGWFLFTGVVALAYVFFIEWEPVTWTVYAQFVPLYIFLVVPPLVRWLRQGAALRLGKEASQ